MTHNDEFERQDIDINDVKDALSDPENEETLLLLTEYYDQLNRNDDASDAPIRNAALCAQILFDEGRYEDVVSWLDEIATKISDEEGPDSETYSAFTEDEKIGVLLMKASDKIDGGEEEEEEDIDEYEDE